MTRGIEFRVPEWARERLKARRTVMKAKKARAALVALEKNTAKDVVDAATTKQEEEISTPFAAVVAEQGNKEEHAKESKKEGNKVDDADDAVEEHGKESKKEVGDVDDADDADDDDDDDDDKTDWYLDLGRGDFWPCYLRFMFIAAYKMIQSEWSDKEDATDPQLLLGEVGSVVLAPLKPTKKLVLNTILRVCPPSTASIPPSSQTKRILKLLPSFLGTPQEEDGSLHLDICNQDEEVISVLGAAGLGPLCDMCRDHHMFISVLDSRRICEVAALLDKLKPYFAVHVEDLAGTPFANAAPLHANLDQMETMDEITTTFSEISSLNCGVTGIVGV